MSITEKLKTLLNTISKRSSAGIRKIGPMKNDRIENMAEAISRSKINIKLKQVANIIPKNFPILPSNDFL